MTITTLEPLLKAHPFFAGIKPEYLRLVTGCAINVRFGKGAVVAREGTPEDQFYLIREGKVAVSTNVPGRAPVTVQTLTTDDVLGWSWIFPPYQWTFDVTALDDVLAIGIDGKCLRGKCEADPALGYDLMKRVARVMTSRLQATRLQLLDVYGKRG
jgi:CRP/FNR family cyclic AMP-dependent transcriptional regulator